MQNLNKVTIQDINNLKSIYKEIGVILIECKSGIKEALFDEIRKRAIIQTLINIKEKIDLIDKTAANENILNLFDKRFRKIITITRNIAAHKSEALNLDVVEKIIKYDLEKIRLRINNFIDNVNIVESREIKASMKKSYRSKFIFLICLGVVFLLIAYIDKSVIFSLSGIFILTVLFCFYLPKKKFNLDSESEPYKSTNSFGTDFTIGQNTGTIYNGASAAGASSHK